MCEREIPERERETDLYLSLSVDTDDATRRLVDGSDKDGLSTDPVHVDTGACLQVIQMDVAKLGDEVDHIVLGAHLTNS